MKLFRVISLLAAATLAALVITSGANQPADADYPNLDGEYRVSEQYWYEGFANAVQLHNKCLPRLDNDKLRAMVLPLIYHEGGSGHLIPPSNTAVSRYDNDTDLRISADTGRKRAFWHPGIGLFQQDDITPRWGGNNATEKFDAERTTPDIAAYVSEKWCQYGFDEWRIWYPWVACRDEADTCDDDFHGLWDGEKMPNDAIDTRHGVTQLDGTRKHDCKWAGTSGTFTCYWVKLLPGDINGNEWFLNAKDSNGNGSVQGQPPCQECHNVSPLSHPFYVFKVSGSPDIEQRYWMTVDTKYDDNITAKRDFGRNSRGANGLDWNVPAGRVLCDQDRTATKC